jgi:hypothetical protein
MIYGIAYWNNEIAAIKRDTKGVISEADKKNVQFFQKIVPGKQKVYGVKTPELNLLAQQYKAHSFDLAGELWTSGALEEKIIAIKIMEKMGKRIPLNCCRYLNNSLNRLITGQSVTGWECSS